MKTTPVRAALVAAMTFLAVAPACASAASAYRCGSAYSDQPCAGGRPVALTDTTPTVADAARAQAANERDERHADRLQRTRLHAQAHQRPPLAGSLGPAAKPAASAPTLPKKKKAKGKIRIVDRDDFTATTPRPVKASGAGRRSASDAPLTPASATPR